MTHPEGLMLLALENADVLSRCGLIMPVEVFPVIAPCNLKALGGGGSDAAANASPLEG